MELLFERVFRVHLTHILQRHDAATGQAEGEHACADECAVH
jgi:hypothetical protein